MQRRSPRSAPRSRLRWLPHECRTKRRQKWQQWPEEYVKKELQAALEDDSGGSSSGGSSNKGAKMPSAETLRRRREEKAIPLVRGVTRRSQLHRLKI